MRVLPREEITLLAVLLERQVAPELHRRVAAEGYEGVRRSWGHVLSEMLPDGATVSAIAEHQGVTTQAISQVVRELEERGFVTRAKDPDDRRVTRVVLTADGEELLAAVRRAHAAIEAEWAARYGRDRVEATRALLRDILADG